MNVEVDNYPPTPFVFDINTHGVNYRNSKLITIRWWSTVILHFSLPLTLPSHTHPQFIFRTSPFLFPFSRYSVVVFGWGNIGRDRPTGKGKNWETGPITYGGGTYTYYNCCSQWTPSVPRLFTQGAANSVKGI